MELRLQLCNYLHRKFGLSYDAKTQTLVKVKASEKINLTLRAIIHKDDEVLISEPIFVSYKPCVIACAKKL